MTDKANVLFVDDEERILRTLKMLFKQQYNVHITTDGHEALEIIKQNNIHVLVSDQRMPIMQGVDLLRAAKEISPNTMRLLLTGYSDLAAIVGSVNEGEIFRYVSKPWDKDEIKQIIAKAVDIALNVILPDKTTPIKEDATIASNLGLLVVDDDKSTYDAVSEIVSGKYFVKWGQDIDQAFEILSNDQNIAVIVSEIKMGKQDISTPLKILKQYHPHTLTLVQTSFQDTSALIELINQGQIYRFLPKPIVKKLLERSIRDSIWHYRFLQKKPELAARHAVEELKEPAEKTISSKIMGYLKKIRGTA